MATDDGKLQMALGVFKQFSTNPGQALLPHNFIAIAAKNDWRNLDVIDGVKLGYAKGFFDDGPNYAIKLTNDGFVAILALNEKLQNETLSNTHDTN